MNRSTRREFLERVSSGFLVAGVGPGLATCFGCRFDDDEGPALTFGALEPLVDRLQSTEPEALQRELLTALSEGRLAPRSLIAAAALANARAFGGENYDGYHDFMALAPALALSAELSGPARFLPLVKVLTRQATHLGESGARERDRLRAGVEAEDAASGASVRAAVLARDVNAAERRFRGLVDRGPALAFDALQQTVRDTLDVHQIVLAQRAYEMIDVVGEAHAHTLLRQSVRHCVDRERSRVERGHPVPAIRVDLPRIVAEFDLAAVQPGARVGDDAWLDELVAIVHDRPPVEAARAVAHALREGHAPEAVGEAISLAANQLHLRDRSTRTHGATSGVHACDSANSWRRIARVTSPEQTLVTLVTAAYHTAHGRPHAAEPLPTEEHLQAVAALDGPALLRRAEAAIRENDQLTAAACAARLEDRLDSPEPLFALLRRYALSEDGRLHAEKLYRTTREEFATVRPSRRWRFLVGLARSTASMHGFDAKDRPGHRAPGYEAACRQLGIEHA